MKKYSLFWGLVLIAGHLSAETLFASYFDIQTGRGAGAEVTGKIHLRSNKDALTTPIPINYTFSITSDPSGLFEIEDQRDSYGRLFGVLKVAPGQTVSVSETDYPVSIVLSTGRLYGEAKISDSQAASYISVLPTRFRRVRRRSLAVYG